MDKKIYMFPEVELIDLELEAALLTVSDGDDENDEINNVIPGEGNGGMMG